jgi:hypothetical protein
MITTAVGERRCVSCHVPLAGQPAYMHGYSKPACGDCTTDAGYQRYLNYPFRSETLSKDEWREQYANGRLPRTKRCEVCGHEVGWTSYRRRRAHTFCSFDCEREHRNRKRRAPKVERPCAVCGELFTPKRRDGKTCTDRCRKALSRMDVSSPPCARRRSAG